MKIRFLINRDVWLRFLLIWLVKFGVLLAQILFIGAALFRWPWHKTLLDSRRDTQIHAQGRIQTVD